MALEETEELISGRRIKVWYLVKALNKNEAGGLWYLQDYKATNDWPDNSDLKKTRAAFELNYTGYLEKLSAAVKDEYRFIFAVPSKKEYAVAFKAKIASKLRNARDLSNYWSKDESIRIATPHSTDEDAYKAIRLKVGANFSEVTSVLIVDDILSKGRTFRAIEKKMRENNLPRNAEIALACALWLH